MKRILYMILLLVTVSCTKTDMVTIEKEVPVSPLASYSFDGKDYSVHTLECVSLGDYMGFLIAREPKAPYSSYISLTVHVDNIGKKLDFSNVSLTKGLDYQLEFEDIYHYYSADFAPKSGTLLVKKTAKEDTYSVQMDIQLHDGKPLKFSNNISIAK